MVRIDILNNIDSYFHPEAVHFIEVEEKPKKNAWQSVCFYVEFTEKYPSINILCDVLQLQFVWLFPGILQGCYIAMTFVQQVNDGTQYFGEKWNCLDFSAVNQWWVPALDLVVIQLHTP